MIGLVLFKLPKKISKRFTSQRWEIHSLSHIKKCQEEVGTEEGLKRYVHINTNFRGIASGRHLGSLDLVYLHYYFTFPSINSLKSSHFSGQTNFTIISSPACSICDNRLSPMNRIYMNKRCCSKLAHWTCLAKSFLGGGAITYQCPLCRAPLNKCFEQGQNGENLL